MRIPEDTGPKSLFHTSHFNGDVVLRVEKVPHLFIDQRLQCFFILNLVWYFNVWVSYTSKSENVQGERKEVPDNLTMCKHQQQRHEQKKYLLEYEKVWNL